MLVRLQFRIDSAPISLIFVVDYREPIGSFMYPPPPKFLEVNILKNFRLA